MSAATIRNAALIEDVEFLASWGESWNEICRRLGRTPAALTRQLHRLGRHDLAASLGAGRDEWQRRAAA